ncbi:DoxX family membrane protein [Streptomyces gardneri]|uniref:DoxX family protein n=1 Tax=Nocardia TaxID=1817 RepID=UPI00135C96F8|nr:MULTISPECIES: DoxX family protein [Nocardia]MBF6163440.1 DoxX family membrane protein [Streptomyces gardneri]UAK35142.1 DoxX family protein [Nocardia asteroides]
MLLRRLARPLLATAFVVDGVDTLRRPDERAKAASELLQRGQRQLPDEVAAKLPSNPHTVVQINALAQVSGGVLLALGKAPRLAALVLAATVVPSAVTEQDFWNEQDPARKSAKRTAFLKDLGLLGGLMIAAADTEGKPSLGWRGRRAARDAAAAVTAALPFGATSEGATGAALRNYAHEAAERARALGSVAASKGTELAETAQRRGPDWAEAAKEHGSDLAETAKVHGSEWAEIAKERGTDLAEVAKERGSEWAEIAKERGADWAEVAKERGADWAEVAKDRSAHLAEVAKQRGAELAEIAKERSAELAERAKHRGPEIAEVAKERGALTARLARRRGAKTAHAAREAVERRR